MTKLKIDMSKIMSVLFNIFRTLRTKIAHGPILGKKEGEKKKSNKIKHPKIQYACDMEKV